MLYHYSFDLDVPDVSILGTEGRDRLRGYVATTMLQRDKGTVRVSFNSNDSLDEKKLEEMLGAPVSDFSRYRDSSAQGKLAFS